ncbi:MAG: 6-phosphogluconolactonase [Hyphomicrobiales bacterium]|nr:6-phosphogluconolactonase [Hyphomicrobiales bacterium]MCP5000766.1 6-phosphogluconolactonase [Hyphomicrobiales bacterium]
MSEPQFNRYTTGQILAGSLSGRIAATLADAIHRDGEAVLAVSGGSTPRLLFQTLSKEQIDWSKVTVVLVDERFVPPSHERANHRLVATQLLQNEAAFAKFIPLYCDGLTPQEAAVDAALKIDALAKPPDVTVLGLGIDGHTASWFPQSPELEAVTDPDQKATVLSASAPGQPEMRLTLTQPIIRNSEFAVLHIEGGEKNTVLENALKTGPVEDLPVRAILRQTKNPLQVYWTP